MAVSDPAVGRAFSLTVKVVAVAAVTVPVLPLLNLTVFLDASVSKPIPVIVMIAWLAVEARLVLVLEMTGVI